MSDEKPKKSATNSSLTPAPENTKIDLEEAKAKKSKKIPSMPSLLKTLIKYGASDLHLKVSRPPLFRIGGKLIPAKLPTLHENEVKELIFSIMNSQQRSKLEEHWQVDFSYLLKGVARFRINAFLQKSTVSCAIRIIPLAIPSFEKLQLPNVLSDLSMRERGLFLVTGATGSGKSTTMASMVDYMNQNRRIHVITIEDPIEFIHTDNKATITQRELGTDATSLQAALRAALRQDPDVIVMGEMRDPETIQIALTAAETGHLVLSTLHTNSASSTISRILDVIPDQNRTSVRHQLANVLVGVLSQRLLSPIKGDGRLPAVEVMVNSPHIEKLIHDNKISEIGSALNDSGNYYQMQTMNEALEKLVRAKLVDKSEAIKASNNPEDLELALSGFNRSEDGRNAKSDGPQTEMTATASGERLQLDIPEDLDVGGDDYEEDKAG